jgi:hypothetical protein
MTSNALRSSALRSCARLWGRSRATACNFVQPQRENPSRTGRRLGRGTPSCAQPPLQVKQQSGGGLGGPIRARSVGVRLRDATRHPCGLLSITIDAHPLGFLSSSLRGTSRNPVKLQDGRATVTSPPRGLGVRHCPLVPLPSAGTRHPRRGDRPNHAWTRHSEECATADE